MSIIGDFLKDNYVAGAAGFGALAGVADFGLSQAGAALDFNRQKKLLDIQNQFSLDMWNRNNEYNSPDAQMQRLLLGGISPSAAAQSIAGQGAALSPNVSSTSAPGVNPSVAPHTMSSALGVGSEIAKNVASAKDSESHVDVNKSTVEKYAHENSYTDAQTANLVKVTSYLDEQQQLDIQTKKEILRQIDAQVDLLISQRKASDKSVEKMDSEIALNSSETDFNRQRTLTEAEMTILKQWYNNYCNQYKFSPEMDFLQAAATLACEGKNTADAYNSLMRLAQDYNYNQTLGKNLADMISKDPTIFEIPGRLAVLFGKNSSDAINATVQAVSDFAKNYITGEDGVIQMGARETKRFIKKIKQIVDDSPLPQGDKETLMDLWSDRLGVELYD